MPAYKISQNSNNINFDLPGHSFCYNECESSDGGTFLELSIVYFLNFKQPSDSLVNGPGNSETREFGVFFHRDNFSKRNIHCGCLYKHPGLKTSHFNEIFSHLLDKMLKEENTCLLMGDFNVNLLNNDNKSEISEFFCPIYPSANRDKQKILKVLLIICF